MIVMVMVAGVAAGRGKWWLRPVITTHQSDTIWQ
eukprot:COSAG01_NODE_37374_length_504_cov_1.143210_1_plen_33_part_10